MVQNFVDFSFHNSERKKYQYCNKFIGTPSINHNVYNGVPFLVEKLAICKVLRYMFPQIVY